MRYNNPVKLLKFCFTALHPLVFKKAKELVLRINLLNHTGAQLQYCEVLKVDATDNYEKKHQQYKQYSNATYCVTNLACCYCKREEWKGKTSYIVIIT